MHRTPLPVLESSIEPPSGIRATRVPAAVATRPFTVDCTKYQTALEKDFPRILTAIQSMWGYPELNTYFRRLTLDNRGDREGFPKEVWEEIFALLYLHQLIVPEQT